MRESLPDLLRHFGFAARPFSSAEEFLASDCIGQNRYLILGIAMPGMTGLDLQCELKLRQQEIPGAASRTGFIDHRFPDAFGFENEFNGFADGAVACMSFRRVVRGVFDLRDGVAHSNGEASAVH